MAQRVYISIADDTALPQVYDNSSTVIVHNDAIGNGAAGDGGGDEDSGAAVGVD